MQAKVICLAAAALTLLGGCQATPEEGVVTGKNDGSFAAALESTAAPVRDRAAAPGVYEGEFTNSDGSVRFVFSLTEPDRPEALPVYRARPAEITAEQAQRIARCLLGEDAVFWEYTPLKSRPEIEKQILDVREKLADGDAVLASFGGDEALAEQYREYYEGQLSILEQMYPDSSDELTPVPCSWTFRPVEVYGDPTWQFAYDPDDLAIQATADVDGVSYLYEAENYESPDRRAHRVCLQARMEAFPETDGADVDVDALKARAAALADAMDVGRFAVSGVSRLSAAGQPDENGPVVNLTLTRVIGGLQMLNGGGENVSADGSQDLYAPAYPYENMFMQFCGDQLCQFAYTGALEITQTVNENVPVLSFDEIAAAAAAQCRLALPMYADLAAAGGYEERRIREARLGLCRMLIRNELQEYYLVPVYEFSGAYAAFNADGSAGTIAFGGQTVPVAPADHMRAVSVNAVDGSVYDPERGY